MTTATGTQRRIKGATISWPIAFGTVATPLAKARVGEGDHTHRWTVQVHGIGDDDLSGIVHSVSFMLHETYTNPQREILSPPYEVTETGWGEFDIGIQINFPPETGEKPILFHHLLRLHPYEDDYSVGTALVTNKKKDIQAWCYDEMVFHEPTERMHQLLTAHTPPALPEMKPAHKLWSQQMEKEELQRLTTAQARVTTQLDNYQRRISDAQDEMARLRRELAKLEPPATPSKLEER